MINDLQCASSVSMTPVRELSDAKLFMTLGLSDVRILNDLIFLDYLTQDNNAFHHMASVLHDLSINSTTTTFGKHIQVPSDFNRGMAAIDQ